MASIWSTIVQSAIAAFTGEAVKENVAGKLKVKPPPVPAPRRSHHHTIKDCPFGKLCPDHRR